MIPVDVVTFDHLVPDYDLTHSLKPGDCRFHYNEDMLAMLPTGRDILIGLKNHAEVELERKLEFTDLDKWAWMFTSLGPSKGVSPHSEGTQEKDHTLLMALNTIPEDQGRLFIEGEDDSFAHTKGRTVVFPSGREHYSGRLTDNVLRVGIATFVYEA